MAGTEDKTTPRRARLLAVLVAVAVATAACGGAVDSMDAGNPTQPTPSDGQTPTPTVVAFPDSPLPPQRPAEFAASFGQDAGMAPWAERIDIGIDSTYEVWMNGPTLQVHFQPTDARLDALYDEVRLGRFDLYEVIPFDDDEMIYDAEGVGWSISVDGYRHNLSTSGQSLDRPDTGHAPLAALSSFVDTDSVPDAASTVTIVVDETIDAWFVFDLGDADFAMGEERWASEVEFSWNGPTRDVPVTVWFTRPDNASGNPDTNAAPPVDLVATFEPGGRVEFVVDPSAGTATVR